MSGFFVTKETDRSGKQGNIFFPGVLSSGQFISKRKCSYQNTRVHCLGTTHIFVCALILCRYTVLINRRKIADYWGGEYMGPDK